MRERGKNGMQRGKWRLARVERRRKTQKRNIEGEVEATERRENERARKRQCINAEGVEEANERREKEGE